MLGQIAGGVIGGWKVKTLQEDVELHKCGDQAQDAGLGKDATTQHQVCRDQAQDAGFGDKKLHKCDDMAQDRGPGENIQHQEKLGDSLPGGCDDQV